MKTITRIIPLPSSQNGISIYCRRISNLLPQHHSKPLIHAEIGYSSSNDLWRVIALIVRNPRISLILTLHDPPVVCGKPFEVFLGNSWLPVKICRKTLDITIGRLVVRAVVRQASALIVLNPFAVESITKSYNVPADSIHFVPAPTSIQVPSKPITLKQPEHLVFFGNISPRKGVLELIQAFVIVAQSHPKVHLSIIGGFGNESKYYQKLLKEIKDSRCENKVTFTGPLSDEKVQKYLAQCNLMVLPYHDAGIVHSSGPLTTAMAFGLTTIASNLPTFTAELTPDRGYILDSLSASCIAQTIMQALDNDKDRESKGKAAAEHIRLDHSDAIIKAKFQEIYESI